MRLSSRKVQTALEVCVRGCPQSSVLLYSSTELHNSTKQKPIEIKMYITGHLSKRFSVDHNK